ncbi:MAG: OadG family protein [Brachyspira sp.]|uniref:OadG family protein n=1 Tax=Candidatus Scatousia sp. TaxID=3085663 RepID=UPI0040297BA5|nr:OadG family protein [Brachyspira sp.]
MMEQFTLHLEEGLVLLGIGMGVVFGFLCVMVFAMNGMSLVVQWLNKLFPEAVEVVEKKGARKNVAEDEAIAIAIAVAKAQG